MEGAVSPPTSIVDATVGSVLSGHQAAAAQRTERGNESETSRRLGLATLLFVAEYRERVGDHARVLAQLERSIDVLRRNAPAMWPPPWLHVEIYPLRLAQTILVADAETLADASTYDLVEFHQSSVRSDAMEAIWFCADAVPRDLVVPRLLSNIAGTLGFVETAIAVAARCCGSTEAFLAAADSFVPPSNFASQFKDRIDQVREKPGLVPDCQGPLLAKEAEVRGLLLDHAMRLTVPVAAPAQGALPFTRPT